ncbi:acetyl-CoA acetyltransferase [Dactylosporangium sp. CS-047395]|uniref:acetyl-CoA acetyltransferase n=1 Tax=Dactylosporangium sp. CS-047395 TaxID=3239936 RepID=UPI003D8FDFA9
MTSRGIRDKVAIVGMGCTRFGELWDRSTGDLLVEAATGCLDSAGVQPSDVDAYWLGTMDSGYAGLTLSTALKTDYRPVTRVENLCATGSEALRNACYAVASGAYDTVMAIGVEKLKDSGYSGLVRRDPPDDGSAVETSAPAAFSYLAPAYAAAYGLDDATMRKVLTHIAVKNHANGALNPRAQFRTPVTAETVDRAPLVAGSLGVFDCSGVADGAAAALIVRAEDAHRYTADPLYVKALAVASGRGDAALDDQVSFTSFPEVVRCAEDAYRQAGVTDPRAQISLAEVHDCFTPTELVLMEDLGFSARGEGWRDVLDGAFDRDGRLPVNVDGGLKAFGHPVGASGLRMLFECWLQLRGEAGPRQLAKPRLGLTHNLGGRPGKCVSFIGIVGSELS